MWNQKYSFELGENHNYVNVCVWVKLSEEKGNLLVGHVYSINVNCIFIIPAIPVGNFVTH